MIDWSTILGDEHYETLKRVFTYPTPSDIPWSNLLRLLEKIKERLGGEVKPAFGGRTRIRLDSSIRGLIHQPENEECTLETNVREIRRVMESAGIMLWQI